MRELTDREKLILELRPTQTRRQIGDRLGITAERVRQIEHEAIVIRDGPNHIPRYPPCRCRVCNPEIDP